VTNRKNGQILEKGQMRFFMASTVQKWQNFWKLANLATLALTNSVG